MSEVIEGDLKEDLAKLLRTELHLPFGWIIIRHEDRFTHAVPDFTVTGNGRTSWWEGKHATPRVKKRGDQELMMQRLARVAFYARYIIWQETKTATQTHVVHPRHIGADDWTVYPETKTTTGFDHQWLLEEIQRVHLS